jgi:hypothetical protein
LARVPTMVLMTGDRIRRSRGLVITPFGEIKLLSSSAKVEALFYIVSFMLTCGTLLHVYVLSL